jgi:Protein of unknown function (DUF4229)
VHLALIKYSVLRLGLFVGSLIVLWAVGMGRSITMLVLAALISLGLSYVLLGKQRQELALAIQARTEARLERRSGIGQADADEEDAAVEAVLKTSAAAEISAREASVVDVSGAETSDRQADGKQQGVDQG